jgi:hypothetical protein
MNKTRVSGSFPHLLVLAAATLALTACSTGVDRVVFATNTSIAVDVDSAPPVLNVGYNRTEGVYGGVDSDGSSAPVVAHLRSDGGLINVRAEQVYATGCASVLVQSDISNIPGFADLQEDCELNHDNGGDDQDNRMFFGTNTNFGLGLTFSATGVQGFHFGLKREEVSILPRSDSDGVRSIPSVIASLSINTTGENTDGTPNAEYGFVQFFGAGDAAIALAHNDEIRGVFDRREAEALTGAAVYDRNVSDQRGQIGSALGCYIRLDDPDKIRARADAQRLGLIETPLVAPAAVDAERYAQEVGNDQLYSRRVGRYVGSDQQRVVTLTRHRNFVCGLANT